MTTRIFTLSALALAGALAACATTHTPPPELLSARDTVKAAEADPLVLRHAPLELKKAGDALRRADALDAKGASLAEVSSAAYVASREAETATALARAKAGEDSIKTAEAERERARADAREAEARTAKRQAAAARTDASNAQVQAVMAQDQAEAAKAQAQEANARADVASAVAVTAQARASSLQQELQDLKALQTDRGMLVTLGDVLFEFGRAEIKPTAMGSLQKLAGFLQQHANRNILIEGFTDSIGAPSSNLALSQRRADAVADALVRLGVAPTRISTHGYGPSFPVADNATDTNRALNRRVEVYISADGAPVRARG